MLEPLECPDAGPGNLLDVTERDAFPEQTDFLLVLVSVALVALAVGRRSSHLDPFPAAFCDVLIPAAFHPLLDGLPLHRGNFEQDGTDKRCDGIDLAVFVEGVEVVILDVERYTVLVEVVDDLECLERIPPQTADFEAYDPVKPVLLDILY